MNIDLSAVGKDVAVFDIGTVARILDISVQTLRLYERRGLILVQKSAGNQRRYTASDIERLRCIRGAITEHKISIEGIRRMQSLVPCWEHVKCPLDQRRVCPAYVEHQAGCWTYKHRKNVCANADCRACPVYQLSSDCEKIKALIHHQTTETPAVPKIRRKEQKS
jgi:MerR family transcriptional regulator, heat shock protein HspR